jgi:hypothetical protein
MTQRLKAGHPLRTKTPRVRLTTPLGRSHGQEGEWSRDETMVRSPRQTGPGVLPRAGVVQAAARGAGQVRGIVEFPVGKESGVTGDGGSTELRLSAAVEIDPCGVILTVTHCVPRSFPQKAVRNGGFCGEMGQTPCRGDRAPVHWHPGGDAEALSSH